MPKKKSNIEFLNEIDALVGLEYTFLEEYQTNNKKIKVIHNKCKNTYEVTPIKFLSGRRCPYCAGNKQSNTEEFSKRVKLLGRGKYILKSEYKNNQTHVLIKHKECGNTYSVKPVRFSEGDRCPYCFGTPKKTTEIFKKEVFDLVGNEYSVMEDYITKGTPILMKHNLCNYSWKVRPNNFLSQNGRCPKCAGNIKKTTEIFKKEVFDLVGNKYTVMGEYTNTNTPIKMYHKKCGKNYFVRPNDFIKKDGNRCPYCYESKGEEKIKKFLEKYNFNYDCQIKIDGCQNEKLLSFDFKIYLNKKEFILLEYDGRQHYIPIFGELAFKKQKENDLIKDNFCKQNNLKLVRICYKDYENINHLLKDLLII
jgi:hypothetical protein